MRKTFRLITLLLVLAMVVSCLVACGDKKGSSVVAPSTNAITPEPTITKTLPNPFGDIETNDDGVIREDLTAIEFQALLGNGINLGNTLEATGGETAWGQPATTKEMMIEMKKGGFDTIRIPVAWVTNAMPNYKIGQTVDTSDEAAVAKAFEINDRYLSRVETVVNYALEADMYVIINDHWDGSWWGMFGADNKALNDTAWALYESMWTQLATRFEKYGDHVIFEGANEELGDRLNDEINKVKGKLKKEQCYTLTYEINQKFVDVVRATGGNNANRFLLVAGYNTDIHNTCDDRFKMPTDTAKSKLLLSVHYYTPWDYCGSGTAKHWGTENQLNEMNSNFEMMKKFVDAGYGVIIGEYAVCQSDAADADIFYSNLLDNCDKYGYVPMLWDCSGLFKRASLSWSNEIIHKIYQDRQADRSSEADKAAKGSKALEDRLKSVQQSQSYKPVTDDEDACVAWLMYKSGDYGVGYSAGDKYDYKDRTPYLKTTDVVVDGEGEYTVGLDFTDTGVVSGAAFMAVGIKNAEEKFPGYIIAIKEIKVDGKAIDITAIPYTTSDDGHCMRVNLYNEWISDVPEGARVKEGDDRAAAEPIVINRDQIVDATTIEVVFDFVKGN